MQILRALFCKKRLTFCYIAKTRIFAHRIKINK